MDDDQTTSKGLAGKITAITAVLVALTGLIAAAGLFYEQTRTFVVEIMEHLSSNGEGQECSTDLPWEEYTKCAPDDGSEP